MRARRNKGCNRGEGWGTERLDLEMPRRQLRKVRARQPDSRMPACSPWVPAKVSQDISGPLINKSYKLGKEKWTVLISYVLFIKYFDQTWYIWGIGRASPHPILLGTSSASSPAGLQWEQHLHQRCHSCCHGNHHLGALNQGAAPAETHLFVCCQLAQVFTRLGIYEGFLRSLDAFGPN